MDQEENRRKRELERDKRGFGRVGATGVAPTKVSGRNREKKGAVRR
ncbi:hypothetical protein K8O68_02960 [Salipaludibacillus sp. CUR1]|nr:hypothetical protein [Salipaludibacillus sp. CUR1]MCE7791382.1 hypothetical protein [Salipaludibacillus sp. CUR1]